MPRASSSLAIDYREGEFRPAHGGTARGMRRAGRNTRSLAHLHLRRPDDANMYAAPRCEEIPEVGISSASIDLSADFYRVFGRGARKELARHANISIDTAKAWLAGKWPRSRQAELAALLLRAVERQESVLRSVRARVEDLLGME